MITMHEDLKYSKHFYKFIKCLEKELLELKIKRIIFIGRYYKLWKKYKVHSNRYRALADKVAKKTW